MSDKIKPHPLERKAILYVRQSSAYHVQNNLASQKLQYVMLYEALEERGVSYAIRILANENLERDIAELQRVRWEGPASSLWSSTRAFSIRQRVGRGPAGWWPKWSITRASYSHEWASSSRTWVCPAGR